MTRRLDPYRRAPLAVAALAALGALGACDFGGPTNVTSNCRDRPLAIRVSAGTTPTFSWTPETCTAGYLDVTALANGRRVWGADGARSGVRYAGEPLTVGARYRVEIGTLTATGATGAAEFTP